MTSLDQLRRDYRVALIGYLATRDERALHAAYLLGRQAMEGGFSLLDLSRIHHTAFQRILADTRPDELDQLVEAAAELFLEMLSSWQMVVDSAPATQARTAEPGA